MISPEELLGLLESRAWYPLVAVIITLVLSRVPTKELPQRWQWVPAVGLAALGAFIDASIAGYGLQAALLLAVYAATTGGMGSVGLHHTAKRVMGGQSPKDA